MVDDQDKALKFYTEVLGFVQKTEIPVGQFNRKRRLLRFEFRASVFGGRPPAYRGLP